MSLKDEVITLISKELQKIIDVNAKELTEILEVPKNRDFGDYALPCFSFAKKLKKAPQQIAQDFANLLNIQGIKKKQAVGPYVNIFIDEKLSGKIIKDILQKKEEFGKQTKTVPQKILIESPGPNTNKPLHLGHLRNLTLGHALGNILKAQGHNVIHVNINNDRGIHICKSMLAYKKFAHNKEPDKKTDHFVGDWYVEYAKQREKHPEMEEEVKEMLKKWEEGDKETIALWKKMNKWAFDGFKQTYDRLGFKIEKEYYESNTYDLGRKDVLEGVKKGIFEKRGDGRIIVNLDKFKLPEKTLLRADGTTVYMTQDIALAQKRYEDYNPDKVIYVVGSEQILHFQQLFKILELLGYGFAKGCYHLSYGMISLPEGKMKSREGTIVDTDNLLDDMIQEAKKEVQQRDSSVTGKELEQRAKKIALGAIKFFILKYDPAKEFVFDKKKSLAFEGATGSYVQYAYVRINAILAKEQYDIKQVDAEVLTEKTERMLINILNEYEQTITMAGDNYKPSLLANYLIELCQTFSNFYNEVQILKESNTKKRQTRLALIAAIAIVIKNGLALLAIDVPQRM